MICPKCQLKADPMIVEERQEDNEGGNFLYHTMVCARCDLRLDATYELIGLKDYYTQEEIKI